MKSNCRRSMLEIVPLRANLSTLKLFEQPVKNHKKKQVLEIRALNMTLDLPTLNQWFNLDYTKKFWGMDGYSDDELRLYYNKEIEKKGSVFYVILIDGFLIAYFEVYYAVLDEIGRIQRFGDNDIGLHFLLGPGKQIITRLPNLILHLTRKLLILAVDYLFTYGNANAVVVEPDVDNSAANDLARRIGFRFCRRLQLSYKMANLYRFSKNDFKNLYRFTNLSNNSTNTFKIPF
jgi:hypothetical protein